MLAFNLMAKFIKREKLYHNINDLYTVKEIKELLEVDVSLKCSQLLSQAADVGTKSKLILFDESITDTDKTNFRKTVQNLPFNVNLIRRAQYLNPTIQQKGLMLNLQMLFLT